MELRSPYRAVQAVSPGRLELTQKTLQAPGPGKVRIRIEACGVCHSDAATVEGLFPIDWPRVPGHEVIGRIAVEKLDGTLVAERRAPRDSFAGHQMHTPWDPLHLAYFNGEALNTYFTTPFLLGTSGVRVEETEPWKEGQETWRVLRAYFPGSIETHSLVQDFFFGDDLMLRRHDYQVNVAGGFAAAQLTTEIGRAHV